LKVLGVAYNRYPEQRLVISDQDPSTLLTTNLDEIGTTLNKKEEL